MYVADVPLNDGVFNVHNFLHRLLYFFLKFHQNYLNKKMYLNFLLNISYLIPIECFNSLDSKSSISSANTESDIDCDTNIKGSPERINILYKL